MQGLTLAAINAVEKYTLILHLMGAERACQGQ